MTASEIDPKRYTHTHTHIFLDFFTKRNFITLSKIEREVQNLGLINHEDPREKANVNHKSH